MSKHAKHVPQHRAPSSRRSGPRRLRRAVIASGAAVAATCVSVSGGVLSATSVGAGADELLGDLRVASSDTRDPLGASDVVAATDLDDRTEQVSRSDRRDHRGAADASVRDAAPGRAKSTTEDFSEADPREIGRALLSEYGFAADQYDCLDALYVSESDWRIDADNPTSSAYGIPQALTRLHDLPADYLTSAESQIRWGLEYISNSYGTPCSAWGFKQSNGWY